jgi:hypothetical protein
MPRIALLLALMGTALVMSAGVALAQATTITEVERFDRGDNPLVFLGSHSCIGERVVLRGGILRSVFHVTIDANGGSHRQEHFGDLQWVGTGKSSGLTYRFTGTSQRMWNVRSADDVLVGPFTEAFSGMLVSEGPAPNYRATGYVHYVVKANGEVTADIERTEVICRG